ncbi:hypothetical protein ACFE04_014212 [Oxalis oulophora]
MVLGSALRPCKGYFSEHRHHNNLDQLQGRRHSLALQNMVPLTLANCRILQRKLSSIFILCLGLSVRVHYCMEPIETARLRHNRLDSGVLTFYHTWRFPK